MGSRRSTSPPPDRLAAVLGEVDRARRGGWVPDGSTLGESKVGQQSSAQGARRTRSQLSERPRHAERARRRAERGRRANDRSGDDAAEATIRPHAPLVRTPQSLQDAQIAPSRLALIAVLVLVVAAAVVLGGRMLWVRTMAEPTPVRSLLPTASASGSPGAATTPGAAAGSGSAGAAGQLPAGSHRSGPGAAGPGAAGPGVGQAGASASTPAQVFVHVVGQVRHPGVVRLTSGARVQDAVTAAGGATSRADLAKVNLARTVTDGEQVVVPKPGEDAQPLPGGADPSAAGAGRSVTGGAAAGGAGPGGAGGAAANAPIDLNAADEAALDTLPGVGPVLAQRIMQWRADNGRFSSIDELAEVSGIGDKLMEQLRPLVRV